MTIDTNKSDAEEYARQLIQDPAWRHAALTEQEAAVEQMLSDDSKEYAGEQKSGVSVIIPTYDGAARIGGALQSMADQNLDPDLYEVICIVNGIDRGTSDEIRRFQQNFPGLNLRLFSLDRGSAGGARNLGLMVARFSHITFVDDDDWVGPEFLSSALSQATENTVVLSPIVDVDPTGRLDADNTLNERIAGLRGKRTKLTNVPWVLGFNACKLVPTVFARGAKYKEDLRSGEDLVYFAELTRHTDLGVVVVPNVIDAEYFRATRPESVSRQENSFDFSVRQRLECIEGLNEIKAGLGTDTHKALGSLKFAQAKFIGRYLTEFPEERDRVYREIENLGVSEFPWAAVHSETARDLAFLYCFAPYSDTSAVVAAKAIAERSRLVDVVTNDMSGVRHLDPQVSALADRWISSREVVKTKASLAGWVQICKYAEQALVSAERMHALNGGYRTVYSRALWVGSHVAAAIFKNRHWGVQWTAEFSDPLRRDAHGSARTGDLVDNETSRHLREAVSARGFAHIQIKTLFDLVELSTMVLADELIFTNQNQLEYMLGEWEDEGLRELVASKATVRHHPVPPEHAYEVAEPQSYVPQGRINIAYFGSFYNNRGIGEILQALSNLPLEVRRVIRIHVYSNKPGDVAREVSALGVSAEVYNRPYVPYMEFLASTRLFDVLLVTDVVWKSAEYRNPFLPSKYSDYLGSGQRIFALVDPGSPLDGMSVDYKAEVGDVPGVIAELKRLYDDFLTASRAA